MKRPSVLIIMLLVVALATLQAPVPASALVPSPVPAPPTATQIPTQPTPVPTPAALAALPARAQLIADARLATDYFYSHNGGATSDASWPWVPYFLGVDELVRATGDTTYRQRLQSWGDRNSWNPDAPPSPTSNPDSRAAIQVWERSDKVGVTPDLTRSNALMSADRSLAPSTYWWIDSLFMGLPLWPTWTARTGDPSYAAQGLKFYNFLKTQGATQYRTGCTNTGLFDPTENLWWRDCQYVPQRDAQGHKVMWLRGNGWVMAAMARTLQELPPGDPQRAEYTSMLQRMATRMASLQPADGMWQTSLLSPSLYPAPETSGTALATYAIAYGIRTGLLDSATFLPVVQKAWAGLKSVSLQASGFISNCQGVAEAPGNPSTTTSIAYCVGAFTMAATEIAKLDGVLASDSFPRTTTNGWGLAQTGGAWTRPSGARPPTTPSATVRHASPPRPGRHGTHTSLPFRPRTRTRQWLLGSPVLLPARRTSGSSAAALARQSTRHGRSFRQPGQYCCSSAAPRHPRGAEHRGADLRHGGPIAATGPGHRTRPPSAPKYGRSVRRNRRHGKSRRPMRLLPCKVRVDRGATYFSAGGAPSPLAVTFDDLLANNPAPPAPPPLAADAFARTGHGRVRHGGHRRGVDDAGQSARRRPVCQRRSRQDHDGGRADPACVSRRGRFLVH